MSPQLMQTKKNHALHDCLFFLPSGGFLSSRTGSMVPDGHVGAGPGGPMVPVGHVHIGGSGSLVGRSAPAGSNKSSVSQARIESVSSAGSVLFVVVQRSGTPDNRKGQGGNVTVRVVIWESPPVTVTV
jgi:hypothetical protein